MGLVKSLNDLIISLFSPDNCLKRHYLEEIHRFADFKPHPVPDSVSVYQEKQGKSIKKCSFLLQSAKKHHILN